MTVDQIQEALLRLGYDVGPIDGDAGPKTISAVTAFQKISGLVTDGIAGDLTKAALTAAVSKEPPPALKVALREPAHLVLARGELGTVENIGAGSNPVVIAYYRDAGFAGINDDQIAWCAAFVGAMLRRSGHKPSGSLAARSYETWGVGLAKPSLGCVGVKRRGTGWQGHVGFVVGASTDRIIMLGGNQGDRVSIASFQRSEFTAFRWPVGVQLDIGHLPTTLVDARAGVREA